MSENINTRFIKKNIIYSVYLIILLCSSGGLAQNLIDDFNQGKSLYEEEKILEALPFFTRIFESEDFEIKGEALIFIAENTLKKYNFNLDIVRYLDFINRFSNDLIQKNDKTGEDYYIIGLGQLMLAGFGLQPEERFPYAFSALAEARKNKYKNAIHFFAIGLNFKRFFDPSITPEELLEAYHFAAIEIEDPNILIDFSRSFYILETGGFSTVSEEKKENAVKIFKSGLDLVKKDFPDYFSTGIIILWTDIILRNQIIRHKEQAQIMVKYFNTLDTFPDSEYRLGYLYHYLNLIIYLQENENPGGLQTIESYWATIKTLYNSSSQEQLNSDLKSFYDAQLTEEMLAKALKI